MEIKLEKYESEYLYIRDLTVSQEGFRKSEQINQMIVFVSSGGVFDQEALGTHSNGRDTRLINLARFEDGRIFIHDGHHRVASIYLGGRKWLHKEEYVLKDWKYSDYTEINFENKWITPFDPRIEVRVCDYEMYKQRISNVYQTFGRQEAINSILRNKKDYVRARRALTIRDLVMRSL